MYRLALPITILCVFSMCCPAEAQCFRRCCKPRCSTAFAIPATHYCLPQTAAVTQVHVPAKYSRLVAASPYGVAQIQTADGLGDYGRWCGANNTSAPNVAPIDGVDAVCKAHDFCINRHGHKCSCDAAFLRGMASASASSQHGEAYRVAAIGVFASKPCYCTFNYPCNCQLFPPRCDTCQGRYPGVGGQCGPRP